MNPMDRSLRRTGAARLIMCLSFGLLLSCPGLNGQTLTIRLLNAKSGKPMKHKKVTVIWVEKLETSEVSVGNDGVGRIEIPQGVTQFGVMAGPRMGKEPNRVAYFDCNDHASRPILIAEVLEWGVVPGNTCGKSNAIRRPGEIVFWAEPLPWWKPDFRELGHRRSTTPLLPQSAFQFLLHRGPRDRALIVNNHAH